MQSTVKLFDCTGSTVVVTEKVKAVQMFNCKYMTIHLNGVVTGIEVVNCKGIKVVACVQLKSASFENSESIKVLLDDAT